MVEPRLPVECQKAHWKVHKKQCRAPAKAGAETQAQQSADDAEQRAKSRVHVGSEEFRHLRGYDMNSLAARVVVTGVKRS